MARGPARRRRPRSGRALGASQRAAPSRRGWGEGRGPSRQGTGGRSATSGPWGGTQEAAQERRARGQLDTGCPGGLTQRPKRSVARGAVDLPAQRLDERIGSLCPLIGALEVQIHGLAVGE